MLAAEFPVWWWWLYEWWWFFVFSCLYPQFEFSALFKPLPFPPSHTPYLHPPYTHPHTLYTHPVHPHAPYTPPHPLYTPTHRCIRYNHSTVLSTFLVSCGVQFKYQLCTGLVWEHHCLGNRGHEAVSAVDYSHLWVGVGVSGIVCVGLCVEWECVLECVSEHAWVCKCD